MEICTQAWNGRSRCIGSSPAKLRSSRPKRPRATPNPPAPSHSPRCRIQPGTLVHVAAATVGLSALIVASAVAFSVVKYAGAAYLVYLGVRKLLERERLASVERSREPLAHAFVRGMIVNVLNPKTALFFLAFLPQFVDAHRGGVWSQALALGFVFVGLGLVSDSLYALAAGTMGAFLRRRRRTLQYGSGLVYVG